MNFNSSQENYNTQNIINTGYYLENSENYNTQIIGTINTISYNRIGINSGNNNNDNLYKEIQNFSIEFLSSQNSFEKNKIKTIRRGEKDNPYNKSEHTWRLREQYNVETMPILKISKYKINSTCDEMEMDQVYYLTPYGLKGSEASRFNSEIIIGRRQFDENENIYNDILLDDMTVSRNHCKIIYSDGFKNIEPLSDQIVSLFMMNHYRLGQVLNVPNLDGISIFNICSYLKRKRQFYIQDCGSILGTYKRIKIHNFFEIKEKQIFMIGSDFNLIIENIHKNVNKDILTNLVKDNYYDNTEVIGELNNNIFYNLVKLNIIHNSSDNEKLRTM